MKPKAEKKKGSRFSAEVAALEKNDPDFFNYLKNEEADILEFSDGDDDDVDVDDVDSDEDEEELDDEENLDDEEDDESVPPSTIDDEEEEAEDEQLSDDSAEEKPSKKSEKLAINGDATSSSAAALPVKIRRDPMSGKRLCNADLLNYLSTILAVPLAANRAALTAAVTVAVDCFKACLFCVGGARKAAARPPMTGKRVANFKLANGMSKKKKSGAPPSVSAKRWKDGKKDGAARKARGGQKNLDKKTSELLSTDFTIVDDDVYDEILRVCFEHLGRCIMILMNPIEEESQKQKNGAILSKKSEAARSKTTFKNWRKHRNLTKQYLTAVYVLVDELQHNEDLVEVALNGVADLVDLYLHFPKCYKQLLKTIIKFWSRSNESAVREAAFLILCKFVRLDKETFPLVYKKIWLKFSGFQNCYVAYISNCKVMTPETHPRLAFMRHSFVELSYLAPKAAYTLAFVYVRQFCVHLRNAVLAKKKDLIPSIYNWQFINGLALWTCVVSQSINMPAAYVWFRDLRHPVIEIICILNKVFMSSKFIPLSIHCIRMLIQFQTSCKLFVPTLALAVELLQHLEQVDKKKPSTGKGSQKIGEMAETLRFSKLQLMDAGVRLKLAHELYKVCVECLDAVKSHPALPEIVVPLCVKIKSFVKKCRNPDHVQLFNSLHQRIKKQTAEVSKLITTKTLNLRDYDPTIMGEEKPPVELAKKRKQKKRMSNGKLNETRRKKQKLEIEVEEE